MTAGVGEPQKHPDADSRRRIRPNQHHPPIGAIDDVTSRQHQRNEGQKLRQAHVPQIERVASQGVDLPADCDIQHLPAQRRAKPGRCVCRKVAVAQSYEKTSHVGR
jgi:hypothetical protein